MTGRKRWMASVVAEAKKDAPTLPFARSVKAAKRPATRIVLKKAAA